MKRSRPPNGRWWNEQRPLDHRRCGTMTQYVRDLLAGAEDGYTKEEIRQKLMANPAFAARIESNPSGFHGIISRLRDREEIKLVGDRLYSTKAPEPHE